MPELSDEQLTEWLILAEQPLPPHPPMALYKIGDPMDERGPSKCVCANCKFRETAQVGWPATIRALQAARAELVAEKERADANLRSYERIQRDDKGERASIRDHSAMVWHGLANIYQILTGETCADAVALGMATSAADALRAENARIRELELLNARLREVLEEILISFEPTQTLKKLAKAILAATRADSAKWLEEQLAKARAEEDEKYEKEVFQQLREAEQHGYKHGRAQAIEDYLPTSAKLVARARKEGEIAGRRWAADQCDEDDALTAYVWREEADRLEAELSKEDANAEE